MGLGTLIALKAGGIALQASTTLKEGKKAEEISKARADIDFQNAEAVREASVEKARIQGERGRKLLEEQKGTAAAGNIRVNVGSPLVIETETRQAIAKDIGFILEQGRAESAGFLSSGYLERQIGKNKRKSSVFDAISIGIEGIGSIASMKSKMPEKKSGSPGGPSGFSKVTKL